MRYKGKCIVTFSNGNRRIIEHVVNTYDKEAADKICAIEFHGSYKHSLGNKVKKYDIIPCVEDTTEKPTVDFVKERLYIINDLFKEESDREKAKAEIYEAFRRYQPSWEDDELSNVLSYCEEGICEKYGDPAKLAENLVDELDGMWCCHYKPHQGNLEEQYQAAVK